MTHKDLIARLEAAEGPSRELDADIFRFLGMPIPDRFADIKINLEWDNEQAKFVCYAGPGQQFTFTPPAYTSSIDAAMTLVAEGWGARLSVVGNLCHVTLVRQGAEYSCAHIGSLATALCIAALKAREASND